MGLCRYVRNSYKRQSEGNYGKTVNKERQPQAEEHTKRLATPEAGKAKEDMCPQVSEGAPPLPPPPTLWFWSSGLRPHCMLLLLPTSQFVVCPGSPT